MSDKGGRNLVLCQEHLTTGLLSWTDGVAEADKGSTDNFMLSQSVQICRGVEPPGFRKSKTKYPQTHIQHDFNTFWLLNGSVKPLDGSTS